MNTTILADCRGAQMIYLRFMWSLLRHKWFVLRAGRLTGVPLWRLIIHDYSKFSTNEFAAYARNFHGDYSQSPNDRERVSLDFTYAWLHHENRNPHHWGYYVSRVGIVVSYDPTAEIYEFIGEEASLGKVDAVRNPLKIIGTIESTAPTLGNDVVNRRIFAGDQQIASDGTTISLSFQFVQEHLAKGEVVVTRCITNDNSPVLETILPTVWQTLCTAEYTKAGCAESYPANLFTFSASLSLLLNSFRLQSRRSLSRPNMQPFQLLLPGCSHSSGTKSHVVGLSLNRLAGSPKYIHEYFRAVGGVSLSEDLLLLLCPGLCLSHRHPPDNDYSTEAQCRQEEKRYWILPGIKLLPMPETYVREMIADCLGASRAYTGSWNVANWLNENGPKWRIHDETLGHIWTVMIELGYVITDNCEWSWIGGARQT